MTGAALVNSGVDKLVFIGSPGVGKLVRGMGSRRMFGVDECVLCVSGAAADTLTPVLLELGGKDAAVVRVCTRTRRVVSLTSLRRPKVCDDADMSVVRNIALRGTYQNCGQNCIGLERLVVQVHARMPPVLPPRWPLLS